MASSIVPVASCCGCALAGMLALLGLSRRSRPRKLDAEPVPRRMRRLVLRQAGEALENAQLAVEEVDTPALHRGQVLVKVAAAPVNPSDEGLWRVPPANGQPRPLGLEGSGTVVASGGGWRAGGWLGEQVAVSGALAGNVCTWAEYAVVDATAETMFRLPPGIAVENGCSFFVNPFTAVGIADTVKETAGPAAAFIHTAGASQVGQMLVRYCRHVGLTLVSVVRREEQAALLRGQGAAHVVVTAAPGWRAELEALILRLRIRCAFDALGAEMAGALFTMLPPGSTVWVYGRLEPAPIADVQTLGLIYGGKRLEGFFLRAWLRRGGRLRAWLRLGRTTRLVRRHLCDIFYTSEFVDTSLEELHADACKLHSGGRTGRKLRVRPHGVQAGEVMRAPVYSGA